MLKRAQLGDVFKTVGLPPYTYVKPTYYGEVRSDILQAGKHVLIEGPSGVGKTCVIFKVFEELEWKDGSDFKYVSCRDPGADQEIKVFFDEPAGRPLTLVVDDFHLLDVARRREIGALLKRLSDRAFGEKFPPKAILIGIPTTGVSLLSDAYDLGPRLGTYLLPRASDHEIERLIDEGEKALNVLFEDREVLLAESAGNFWLAQYVCNKVCATQGIFEAPEEAKILTFDLLGIRQRLMAELTQRYMPVARKFAKGKKWRPGGNKPYLEVLLALCKIPELVITFDKMLNLVPERRRPGIKAIRQRIAEVIRDPGRDLRAQITFDPDSGFSIEDPLFRYFLTNLDVKVLLSELGIEGESLERSRCFTYDVGFSFAGEARKFVEIVNAELKSEDVVTFYDYDQQAFLLAMDLEGTLARIYGESCCYYLVFIDRHYREKVWTRYERDIMTKSGRRAHIIPVLIDDHAGEALVGVSTTIGRVDLRDVWAELQREGVLSKDATNVVRNRCVLPVLEKIDAPDQTV